MALFLSFIKNYGLSNFFICSWSIDSILLLKGANMKGRVAIISISVSLIVIAAEIAKPDTEKLALQVLSFHSSRKPLT